MFKPSMQKDMKRMMASSVSSFSSARVRTEANNGLVGFHNLGNSCFINAAMQCLSSIQPLTEYFLNLVHVSEINDQNILGSKGDVSLAYGELVREMWEGLDCYIRPSRFYQVLKKYNSNIIDGRQQDVQEYIAFLLDYLHEDLNRAVHKKSEQQPNTVVDEEYKAESQEEQLAFNSWKQHLKINRSIIVDLFQGQLRSTLKCLKCKHKTQKFDCFMYLSLPIPDHDESPTIQDCIEEYTKEEELDEPNWWECDVCKKKQPSTKKIDIWKLPVILIVHLKRFSYDGKQFQKIDKLVQFPD